MLLFWILRLCPWWTMMTIQLGKKELDGIASYLENRPMRIGYGYDIHRLVVGRPLVLGGVDIPCEVGLDGHSDADCLTHALADAIFGALALPDIGHWFSNTDPSIRGMDSRRILEKAVQEAEGRGWMIGNVDCVIIAERPKISPYLNDMKASLSVTMGIRPDQVGIKATTNEKVGDIGKGLAIASHATCLLMPVDRARDV